MFLSCVFINFIFVFLTSGQDGNSWMQKRIHFRTDMEHNICRPVNNSDVSLGYQFCKNITFILYNVRYNNKRLPMLSLRIATNVSSSVLAHGEVHSIKLYVMPVAEIKLLFQFVIKLLIQACCILKFSKIKIDILYSHKAY